MMKKGRLYGVGLGPGDPELITLKALRIIERLDVIAYHQAKGRNSHALQIAQNFIGRHHIKLPLVYPLTKEFPVEGQEYQTRILAFYDEITTQMTGFLERGLDVGVLVAGDPLLYSSFMPIYQRLGKKYETIIIPGIISATAAAAAAGLRLCAGNENFTILSALLPEDELKERLQVGGGVAILKLGVNNFDKVCRCLHASGRASQAFYIEAATTEKQKILHIREVVAQEVPYFSLILVGA